LPFRTIQAAVDRARRGDATWVCPGLYAETVKVETERLTINGANTRTAASPARRTAPACSPAPATPAT
jgi:pectin methylesterase-like acyl-CoA thioesterase